MACVCAYAAESAYVYDSQGKRNPFMPLVTSDGRLVMIEDQPQKNTVLTLQGIAFDKNGISYALVNGEVARVSDYIGEYQVLRIEKRKVIFIKDSVTSEVELKKEE